jgi:hypothetical protein
MRESYVARALPSSPPSLEVHSSGPPAEADSVDDHGVQPQWLAIKPRPELPHDSMLLLSDDPILEQPVDTKPEPRLEINTVLTELVYLLHFERPFHGPMQHYVGFTDDLDLCLDQHRNSTACWDTPGSAPLWRSTPTSTHAVMPSQGSMICSTSLRTEAVATELSYKPAVLDLPIRPLSPLTCAPGRNRTCDQLLRSRKPPSAKAQVGSLDIASGLPRQATEGLPGPCAGLHSGTILDHRWDQLGPGSRPRSAHVR